MTKNKTIFPSSSSTPQIDKEVNESPNGGIKGGKRPTGAAVGHTGWRFFSPYLPSILPPPSNKENTSEGFLTELLDHPRHRGTAGSSSDELGGCLPSRATSTQSAVGKAQLTRSHVSKSSDSSLPRPRNSARTRNSARVKGQRTLDKGCWASSW